MSPAPDPTLIFRALALLALLALPLYALRVRGRGYALFGLLILRFSLAGVWATERRLAGWLAPGARAWAGAALAWGTAAAVLHLAHLVRARLRGPWFRLAISVPGQAFLAAGFRAGPWQLALWPVRAVGEALGYSGFTHALPGSIRSRSRWPPSR